MKRFMEGEDRSQSTLFPERLDDYIAEDNPVRVIGAFVDELDLNGLGFDRVEPEATGERQMQRWIGAVQFSEHAMGSTADGAREQYTSQHPEQPLLAFVVSETNQWLRNISVRNAEAQSDKFVMMASMNLVNCIAGAPVSSAIHG